MIRFYGKRSVFTEHVPFLRNPTVFTERDRFYGTLSKSSLRDAENTLKSPIIVPLYLFYANTTFYYMSKLKFAKNPLFAVTNVRLCALKSKIIDFYLKS